GAAQDLVGLSPEALFADAAEYGRFGAQAAPVLAAGKSLDIEWQGRRRDGSTFLGHTIARAIQAPGYRFATICIVEDITARREAERALKEALDRQNAIFTASPYGISVFQERRFVVSSPSFERMFGYKPGEVVGKGVRILFESDEEFDRIGQLVYGSLS